MVPQCVVDLLEAIEIEHHQPHLAGQPGRGPDCLARAVVEQASVGQIRECVVERQVLVLRGPAAQVRCLPAQARRGARDDAIEGEVEQREPGQQDHREIASVMRDRRLDRTVRQVELEGAANRPAGNALQRRIHLEQLPEAPVGCIFGSCEVRHLGRGRAPSAVRSSSEGTKCLPMIAWSVAYTASPRRFQILIRAISRPCRLGRKAASSFATSVGARGRFMVAAPSSG